MRYTDNLINKAIALFEKYYLDDKDLNETSINYWDMRLLLEKHLNLSDKESILLLDYIIDNYKEYSRYNHHVSFSFVDRQPTSHELEIMGNSFSFNPDW